MMVPPGFSAPDSSSASTMAMPMRSLTEASGLKNSSLASTVALAPSACDRRGSLTSGVSPMVSRIESNTLPRPLRDNLAVAAAFRICAGL